MVKYSAMMYFLNHQEKTELLLGIKLSGHTDTLIEGSNLIDEI